MNVATTSSSDLNIVELCHAGAWDSRSWLGFFSTGVEFERTESPVEFGKEFADVSGILAKVAFAYPGFATHRDASREFGDRFDTNLDVVHKSERSRGVLGLDG